MSFFEAILLGIVQGIAEFFPVSSSGHLVILEQIFGIENDQGIFLNIILHIGTAAAVVVMMRKELLKLIYSFAGIVHDMLRNCKILVNRTLHRENTPYIPLLRTANRRLVIYILLTNIPTLLIGSVLHSFVSGQVLSLFVVGFSFFVTGLLLFIADFAQGSEEDATGLSWKKAAAIGACQGFSVIPGVSRYGITLSAGLYGGLSKASAVKYSFLISVPTFLGAAVYELFQLGAMEHSMTFGFVVCCIFAGVAAFFAGSWAIRKVMWIVKKSKLKYFAFYCFFVGMISILLYYTR